MANVSVRNLLKTYPGGGNAGQINAIRDVTFEIGDGEFGVLVGPSGSGKSTLLRITAGLESSSRGEIFIRDRRVNDVAPKDREIAMVAEESALYPHLSVYDNMAFGLKLRKFSETEIKKRVEDAASILKIEELLDRKPKALSTGERQRVALGRAVVRQPKVFLFDEPLASLDPNSRAQMRGELARLHQRVEATMIYATQNEAEAMALADRLIVLDQGVVQQIDTPRAVYEEPANLFVAGYVGSPRMNLIYGTLKQERDSLLFREAEGGTIEARFKAADRTAAGHFGGKAIVLGIRPEEIWLVPLNEGRDTARTGFPALVDIIETAGAQTDLHLQTGAHTLICRSDGRALSHRGAGRRMRFEMNLTRAHLFDPESKRRVG